MLSEELRFFAAAQNDRGGQNDKKSLRITSNYKFLKILDVGCGTGFLAPVLRDNFPDAEIIGIDTASEMINIAQKRYGKLAKFKVWDFMQYKEKCDLIVSINTFYFFEMSQIVEKVKELLKPGGACIIISYARAPFSVLHQFYTALLLRTFVKTYAPSQFYEAFSSVDFAVSAKRISEIEGTYLLKIKHLKS